MILLKRIHIEGFRSIRNATIEPLADLTSFAGLNNAGKSNVLRALNAFFNDETDPGSAVDIDTDFFRPDLRKKKRKKRIRITVTFELPNHFRFRKGLGVVERLLQGRQFSLTKEWVRDDLLPALELNGKALNFDDRQTASKFLQLIKYRYVPNCVLPIALIRDESQSLRDVLVRRLARQAKGQVDAFVAIRKTSARMIESLTKLFDESCPGQGTVSLATPTSWNDLVFAFGYRFARDGIEIRDAEQGSGIQSFLMLQTLYLIDKDYFQQFGWRQAAVWGLEEPESSLHTSLEARIASYLSTIATDPSSRLQVLCTTHSDLMVQYSGCTVGVEHRDRETTLEPFANPREALEWLSSTGVSRWVHPVLCWPLDPVILVEGPLDRNFLNEAFRFFKPSRPVHVVVLPELDETAGGGGIERMKQYVKDSASAIRSRRCEAPVIVVLDWDASSKADSFKNLVKNAPSYKVLVWPEDSANPKAGRSFKGIERFHCNRVLDLAIERGAAIGQKPKGPQKGHYMVEAAEYDSVKRELDKIVREGLNQEDFKHAEAFVKKILAEAGAQ